METLVDKRKVLIVTNHWNQSDLVVCSVQNQMLVKFNIKMVYQLGKYNQVDEVILNILEWLDNIAWCNGYSTKPID